MTKKTFHLNVFTLLILKLTEFLHFAGINRIKPRTITTDLQHTCRITL